MVSVQLTVIVGSGDVDVDVSPLGHRNGDPVSCVVHSEECGVLSGNFRNSNDRWEHPESFVEAPKERGNIIYRSDLASRIRTLSIR
jgi:hypothetical protein